MTDATSPRFAHGKVILLGEHGVVYGHLALSAAIDRGVLAVARPAETDRLRISPWGVDVGPDPAGDDPLSRAFSAVLGTLPETRPSVAVEAEVALPGGAGLGCSAALGVAVLAAVEAAVGVESSPADRAVASLAWERVFHGNPSGVDNATAALGGVLAFRRGATPVRFTPARPLELVVAHSGSASSTRAMVEGLARRREAAPGPTDTVLGRLGALAEDGRLLLERGELDGFGAAMDEAHAGLGEIGLSTPRLDRLCLAARHAGALGAKLTGAGGGGCIVALVADPETAATVAGRLADAEGADAFTTRVGP